MENELVYTLVMAHYKQPRYWREAIDSVLQQDYPAIELIFADDASPDFNGAEVSAYIEQHKRENLVRYEVFTNPYNIGTVKSLNRGLGLATGGLLQVMAADDVLFDTTVFSRFAQAFAAETEDTLAITTCAKLYDENLEKYLGEFFDASVGYKRNGMTAQEQYQSLIFGCVYLSSATVYRKEVFEKVGHFDQRYRLIEDAPFWCRMTKMGHRIVFKDFFSILHRMGGVSHPTHEKPTPLRREYRMEELAFFSWELAQAIPELPEEKQKLAFEYYSYCKDAYIGVSGMYIVGLNEQDLFAKAPALIKAAKKKRLKKHYEGWMRGCTRSLVTFGVIWVVAALLFFFSSFSPAATALGFVSRWVCLLLMPFTVLSLAGAVVFWILRFCNIRDEEAILRGETDE